MQDYYFLASALPELQIGVPPELGFEPLMALMHHNLSERDRAQVKVLRTYYDILNIRLFLRNESQSPYGNYNAVALEEMLLTKDGLPDYVVDYLDRYDEVQGQLEHFPALLVAYFSEESQRASGFLADYLTLERGWRLVLTAFRAKKEGRDLAVELQYEDPGDELIAQLLAQKDAPKYEPPARYQLLTPLFDEYGNAPMALHQAISEFRFEQVHALTGVDLMSMAPILSYLVRVIIAEQWLELDRKKGMEIVDTILKEAV